MYIKELILKVSSICNLNCQYCYVFNQGDFSFEKEPNLISTEVILQTIERIKQHCFHHNLNDFLVIFHGGEPLLLKKEFYINFVNATKDNIKNIKIRFGLQTNATLLTQEWLDLLKKLKIQVGISIDGTPEANKYRVYRSNGKNAYDEIIRGINLLKQNKYPIRTLSVINIDETPSDTYSHLKKLEIRTSDFLFPDSTFDIEKSKNQATGFWLIELFNLWYNDNDKNKPVIRLFDVIIKLLLGQEDSGNEVLGLKYNRCICVKSNGNIETVDSLKICGDGFTKTKFNVKHNTFDDALKYDLQKMYYNAHQDNMLCDKCKQCIIKSICGGGRLAHRYSSVNKFDNPSVYCSAVAILVMHIQNTLINDMPELKKAGMEVLTKEDFL